MKENDGGKHAHHIAQTDHRIGHAERKVLDDIHPQDGASRKTESTAYKLLVGEQPAEILPSKRKFAHFSKAVFHEHLPTSEQGALNQRYG